MTVPNALFVLAGQALAAQRPPMASEAAQGAGGSDRAYWKELMWRLAGPPLAALAEGRLHARMPCRTRPGHGAEKRKYFSLEAAARVLVGAAPWLERTGADVAEEPRRARLAELAQESVRTGVEPGSPDAFNFDRGGQPLVDTAFLAQALLRGRKELWEGLDARTRDRVIDGMRRSRRIVPAFNNWLLFSAMVEAFLEEVAGEGDLVRVEFALRQFDQWHFGGGAYGDGPHFAWDYYNSFVIHPMVLDLIGSGAARKGRGEGHPALDRARWVKRAQAMAGALELMISPEGAYPPMGRSITYRMAAFQLLAQLALQGELPESLTPAGVRCALTAVMRRLMEAPGTFDGEGWLRIGLAGHQPGLGESYIGTASLYLCTAGLLPLGLAPSHEFWSGPFTPWTSLRLFRGEDAARPHLYA